MSKNNEVKVSDVIEDLKVRKLSSHKYVDNVETEYDKMNQVDMSDDKEYSKSDQISKNDEENLNDVDQESEEIDQIEKSKEDYLESDKSETYERYHIENLELLKNIDSPKKGDNDNPVDTDIDLETNVIKKTESSSSALVEIQLTENPDDMVDTEEEIDFYDLTITGNLQ